METTTEAELEKIMAEVFWQEDRYTAELRLLPTDAQALSQNYGAQCVPMEGDVCLDGKRWYRVWIPIQM